MLLITGPILKASPAVLNAPPSIHQVQVFFRDRSGRRLHRHRLVHVSGASAWSGGGECYNRSAPARRAIRSPWLWRIFSSQWWMQLDCIIGLALLLRGTMANTSESESRRVCSICHSLAGITCWDYWGIWNDFRGAAEFTRIFKTTARRDAAIRNRVARVVPKIGQYLDARLPA